MTHENTRTLLDSYPRDRPPLTEGHERVYVEEYRINRGGRGALYGLIRRLESWGHRQVATLSDHGPVLEIGAGSLNHLEYEPGVVAYDCVEPFAELYEGSPDRARVRNLFRMIEDIPDDLRYSRVISLAVLEHLERLPHVVARSGLLLSADGVFQAVIPSDGGLLWGISWRCATALAYRMRTDLDYGTLMRHEHVNSAADVGAVVAYFFKKILFRRFPLPIHHLSFYTYVEASRCNVSRCQEFLADASTP